MMNSIQIKIKMNFCAKRTKKIDKLDSDGCNLNPSKMDIIKPMLICEKIRTRSLLNTHHLVFELCERYVIWMRVWYLYAYSLHRHSISFFIAHYFSFISYWNLFFSHFIVKIMLSVCVCECGKRVARRMLASKFLNRPILDKAFQNHI